jgi:tetraacyldisaccharide 4'-kinase
MIDNKLLRLLLWPFSMLYGAAVGLRNVLYETEILKSSRFSLPIISVGNLTMGGAGKTPHVEYIIRLLQPYINVGTLSRGYNRKTSGFRFVSPNDSVDASGDEPLIYAKKYQDVVVAVCESRALAIPEMVKSNPQLQTIVLDDAFQHRSVVPDINILLTQYALPYTKDYLLPC